MSEVEFDRPLVERISTSPPQPIAWEKSEQDNSLELKQPRSTVRMEVAEISYDQEDLPAEAHESRIEDDVSDDTSDNADLEDEEASEFVGGTETGMDMDIFIDDYGDANEDEEAETREEYDEPLAAGFIGRSESEIYDEEDNIDPAAIEAATRDANGNTLKPELEWNFFTKATRSGYEDAYPTDFSKLVQSHRHRKNVGDPDRAIQHSNEGDCSAGLRELVQFREHEEHAWGFNKISQYSNEATRYQKLTDTQQTKKEYADAPFASRSPIRATKKKQIQSIDLTESDDDVEVQVLSKKEIDIVELMEVETIPMQDVLQADLSRLPRDCTPVQFEQKVGYKPKSHYKVASPSYTQFKLMPKVEPKVQREVNRSKHIAVARPHKDKVKVLTKGNFTEPKYVIEPSILPIAATPNPHLSGHEIFEIPLVDLLDVQRLRNLINCTLLIPTLFLLFFQKALLYYAHERNT
jgi:hypothetical protein